MPVPDFIGRILNILCLVFEKIHGVLEIIAYIAGAYLILYYLSHYFSYIVRAIKSVFAIIIKKLIKNQKIYKECEFDTIVLIYRAFQHKGLGYVVQDFRFCYEASLLPAENIDEADEARRRNEKKLSEFENEFAKNLCRNSPCLFDRFGYVGIYGKSIKDDPQCTFRLDGEKKIKNWLDNQESIRNLEGHIVAVRGINEETTEQLLLMIGNNEKNISKLIVPDVEEKEIIGMTLEELMQFCDLNRCKFRINNGNALDCKCCFEFSEKPGYTKPEMEEAAKELACKKGYIFKTDEERAQIKLKALPGDNMEFL